MDCEGSNVNSEEGNYLHDKLASEEVYVEAPEYNLCGKIDVLTEGVSGEKIPIEYKRGSPMEDGQPWIGHATQLCALGLLLEHVLQAPIDYGYIWYNQNRQRVKVVFSETLREKTFQTIQAAQQVLDSDQLPEPLSNRKACLGCNQYRNCLPDEIQGTLAPVEAKTIIAPHIEGQAVYIDRPGSKLSVKNGCLVISSVGNDKPISIGLERVNQVVIQQGANCTSGFMEACAKNKIPVMFLDWSGRWQGSLQGSMGRNVFVRLKQYQGLQQDVTRLILSKQLVRAKLTNQRTWLRRHLGTDYPAVEALARILKTLDSAETFNSLMGMEGEAARHFFTGLSAMVKPESDINWEGRLKHPSPDPLNSLLSYGYSILQGQVQTGCHLAGLDPHLGFYHGLKHGKPALVLDLMEIYRTPIVDATVVGFINRGQCSAQDFEQEGSVCRLKPSPRKAFIQALFERFNSTIKHPIFGYTTTYQRAIHVEARLFSYALTSGLDLWQPFTWR